MPIAEHAHISEETLELYSLKRLQEPDTALVEEHLLTCELCQDRLQEIDDFVGAFKRAVARDPKMLAQGMPARWWRGLIDDVVTGTQAFFVGLRPMYAAGGIAAVVLMAFVLVPRSVEPDGAPVSTRLDTVRGDAGGGATAPAGKRLALDLDLSELPPTPSFRLEVAGADGNFAWHRAALVPTNPGRLDVTTDVALKPGRYWVRLFGLNDQLLREFALVVR